MIGGEETVSVVAATVAGKTLFRVADSTLALGNLSALVGVLASFVSAAPRKLKPTSLSFGARRIVLGYPGPGLFVAVHLPNSSPPHLAKWLLKQATRAIFYFFGEKLYKVLQLGPERDLYATCQHRASGNSLSLVEWIDTVVRLPHAMSLPSMWDATVVRPRSAMTKRVAETLEYALLRDHRGVSTILAVDPNSWVLLGYAHNDSLEIVSHDLSLMVTVARCSFAAATEGKSSMQLTMTLRSGVRVFFIVPSCEIEKGWILVVGSAEHRNTDILQAKALATANALNVLEQSEEPQFESSGGRMRHFIGDGYRHTVIWNVRDRQLCCSSAMNIWAIEVHRPRRLLLPRPGCLASQQGDQFTIWPIQTAAEFCILAVADEKLSASLSCEAPSATFESEILALVPETGSLGRVVPGPGLLRAIRAIVRR